MKVLLQALLLVTAAAALAASASAKPWWLRGVESNDNDFLAPDMAFRVSSRVEGQQLRVTWVIADGYYLYRQRMSVVAESPDLVLTVPAFPPGKLKTDPYLGTQEIFTQQVEGTVSYTRSDAGAHPLQIRVTYQGCAEAGLCYPPISKVLFPRGNPPSTAAAGLGAPTQQHPWEGYAILGGGIAFLVAGLLLRKGRRIALPA